MLLNFAFGFEAGGSASRAYHAVILCGAFACLPRELAGGPAILASGRQLGFDTTLHTNSTTCACARKRTRFPLDPDAEARVVPKQVSLGICPPVKPVWSLAFGRAKKGSNVFGGQAQAGAKDQCCPDQMISRGRAETGRLDGREEQR